MPAAVSRAANRLRFASLEFEALSRQRLTGELPRTAEPPARPARPARRSGRPLEPWLGRQLRAQSGAARARLRRALVRAGYSPAVLAEDAKRPLLELGTLPFYRLDLYRHWLLAEGGDDVFAALRQRSPHLDADPGPAG